MNKFDRISMIKGEKVGCGLIETLHTKNYNQTEKFGEVKPAVQQTPLKSHQVLATTRKKPFRSFHDAKKLAASCQVIKK